MKAKEIILLLFIIAAGVFFYPRPDRQDRPRLG